MRTRYYTELVAWQQAMSFACEVYAASACFPKEELFGLRAQIRRAAVSVPSNIAEGHGRLSDKSFRVFLAQARGSLYEVETQIMLAADFNYITPELRSGLLKQSASVGRVINGLMRTLRDAGK